MITDIGHIALRVPDLDASVEHATQVMGLRVTERTDDAAYLSHDDSHHSLQLLLGDKGAFDHMSFIVNSEADLETLKDALDKEGAEIISETPDEPGITGAIRFCGPGEHVFEVYYGMSVGEPDYTPVGVRPSQFGHVTINSSDMPEMRSFTERVLGFRLSDIIGDMMVFLRFNPNHHGMAMAAAPVDQLNHYAWEIESISELGRLGDHLDTFGKRFVWGPGRHGPGNNIFTYHLDPAGAMVEYYADMHIVLDEESYTPASWEPVQRTMNFWGPVANENIFEMGLDCVKRS